MGKNDQSPKSSKLLMLDNEKIMENNKDRRTDDLSLGIP